MAYPGLEQPGTVDSATLPGCLTDVSGTAAPKPSSRCHPPTPGSSRSSSPSARMSPCQSISKARCSSFKAQPQPEPCLSSPPWAGGHPLPSELVSCLLAELFPVEQPGCPFSCILYGSHALENMSPVHCLQALRDPFPRPHPPCSHQVSLLSSDLQSYFRAFAHAVLLSGAPLPSTPHGLHSHSLPVSTQKFSSQGGLLSLPRPLFNALAWIFHILFFVLQVQLCAYYLTHCMALPIGLVLPLQPQMSAP